MATVAMMTIRVDRFAPQYAEAFAALNREWIETYFEIEDEDLKVLNNPQGYVLDGGGEIFFALCEEDPAAALGTVAMVKTGATTFELAKMAVSPRHQGLGIGRLLMDACTEFARVEGASEIFLITNDILAPAMALYEKSGFVRQPSNNDTRYSRGNTEMRLALP